MAHMLSLTASSVVRPTATLRSGPRCPARLTTSRINGRAFLPASAKPKRSSVVQVVRARSAESQAREVESEAKGLLAGKGQQKAVYTFLALAWAAVAVVKLFATHQFSDFAFDIADPGIGIQGLQRLAGFSSLAPAVASYTLAKAAKGERLDSHTYLRQNLGLFFAGALTLYYLWKTPVGVITATFQKAAIALSSFTAVVAGLVYAQTSGHGFNPVKIAEGFGSSLAGLFSPDNLNSTVYSLLSAGLGAYAAVLLFGPHELAGKWLVIGNSQVSLYLQREIGLSAALGAIQTYCLKDAADRNKLGRSTFKNLNLALAAIAAGNFTALWWAVNTAKLVSWTTQGYVRLAFLGVQFITFAYNWLEADKDEDEQLSKAEDAFDSAVDNVKGALSKGEHKAEKWVNKARGKAEDVEDDVEGAAKDVKRKGEKYADKAQSKAERSGDWDWDPAEDAKQKGDRWYNKLKIKADAAGTNANRTGDWDWDPAEEAKHSGDRWYNKLKNAASRIGDDAEDSADSVKRKGEKYADKAEGKAKEAGNKAEKIGDKIQREAKDLVD